MIAFIRDEYKIGDYIKLHTHHGEFSGRIRKISDQVILLEAASGKTTGVKDDAIDSFEALAIEKMVQTERQKEEELNYLEVEGIKHTVEGNGEIDKPSTRQMGPKIVGKIELDAKEEKRRKLRQAKNRVNTVIPNPYERLANGGPVTDTSMFYGRKEFIDVITEAILTAESKQVIIFGQKRSGKSSVLFHLRDKLKGTLKTFPVSFSIGDIFENLSTASFFYKILAVIAEELEALAFEDKVVPAFVPPTYQQFCESPNPADLFRKNIRRFKRESRLLDDWKDRKLVIMIDEFTYLYTAIKDGEVSGSIMKQWKAITQNQDSTFSSVLVGQDVFPEFKAEFPNEFGVTQDQRLTYLAPPYARKLIEEPVWNKATNKSRFVGNAVDAIIEYTSCNPYYIQIFCARLITEMNRKKSLAATKADVEEVADSFIYGGNALADDKFDNLLNPGEKYDIQKIPAKHAKAVLRQIANGSRTIGFCPRENISIEEFPKEYEDEILEDLVHREILERKQGKNFKIQVKLFERWLLKN